MINEFSAGERDDTCVSTEAIDSGKVERANAVDHGLVKGHAGLSPFLEFEHPVVENVDHSRALFSGSIHRGLDDAGTGTVRDSAICCRDDVELVSIPFGVRGHERIDATVVDGTAHALGGIRERFFVIAEMNARMNIVGEWGLENGDGNGCHGW